MPAEKNQAGFSVIAPRIEKVNVATKNEVKSLNNAFWALSESSFTLNPKSLAAIIGVNTQLKTRPKTT